MVDWTDDAEIAAEQLSVSSEVIEMSRVGRPRIGADRRVVIGCRIEPRTLDTLRAANLTVVEILEAVARCKNEGSSASAIAQLLSALDITEPA